MSSLPAIRRVIFICSFDPRKGEIDSRLGFVESQYSVCSRRMKYAATEIYYRY